MSELDTLREEISNLDEEIIKLLAKRFEVVKKIGEYKKRVGFPIRDGKREKEIIGALGEKAAKKGMSSTLITNIWSAIFKEAYTKEK